MIKFLRQKINLEKSIFLWLFYIDLFFALMPSWSGSPLYKFVTPETWGSIWLLGSIITVILLGGIIIINHRVLSINDITVTIIILWLLFLLSIVINGFKSGGFAIIGIPVSLILFFYILKDLSFKKEHLQITFYILLIWSIIPLIMMVVSPSLRASFFTAPEGNLMTFSGFALHRNFYGIITGLALLLVYFKDWHRFWKLVILMILTIGILLSACRTAMLAVILSFLFILFMNKRVSVIKKTLILFMILLSCGIIYSVITNPQYALRKIDKDSNREALYSGFYELILEDPILGKGENVVYTSHEFPEGAPAHNFILQTSANYGIPALLFWCLLLLLVYKHGKPFAKLGLVYLFLWGITQPYWGFGVFSAHIVVILFVFRLMDCHLLSLSSRF